MPTDIVAEITNQPLERLKPIVGQILGEDATPAGVLNAMKIGRSIGQGTAGIFHVTGHAHTKTGNVEWTAVSKALGKPAIEVAGLGDNDALREIEVYRSGVFADICGGVRSARCYAIQPLDDLSLLWLEDLSSAPQPPWATEHFVATARNLGRFNAHWPETALPEWEWLNRRGFRRQFTEFFHRLFQRVPENLDHPLMRPFADHRQELLQLWDQCADLLSQVEKTAKGVSHMDSHATNLFPMQSSAGESYTVGIDWSRVGIDNLGLDIGQMLDSAMLWMEVAPDELAALRDPMLDAYLVGIAEAGWSGHEKEVRLSFFTRLACAAIRQICLVSHAIDDPKFREMEETLMQKSLPEFSARYAAYMAFCLDCKDEAYRQAARI